MREIWKNLSLRAIRVWQRDADVYFTTWKTEFLPPLLEPILYVFAFGLGLGQLIHEVRYQGRSLGYLPFMAPGVIAIAVMFWAFFETTFSSYVRMYYQKTYDAIVATPLLVEDVILGEILWATTKAVIAATIMLLVLTALRLVAWPSGLLVIPIAAVGGLLFAGLGLVTTSMVKAISQFNVAIFLVIMPMFTFGGARRGPGMAASDDHVERPLRGAGGARVDRPRPLADEAPARPLARSGNRPIAARPRA